MNGAPDAHQGLHMTRLIKTLFLGTILASSLFGQRYAIRESETIRRTLEFSGSGTRMVELDNIEGSVHVTGYGGSAVEMVANKTIHAESPDRVQTAQQEVKLDIADKAEVIRIYVEGPFRCNCPDGRDGWRTSGWRSSGYRVDFDFDLRVPRDVKLRLRTVNGETKVENSVGDFEVRDVNGAITMTDINGSGSAETVNGGVTVSFLENPKSASSFKTINGQIEVAFQPSLSADLLMKTSHGGLFTDFPTTPLPVTATAERRNGKFVYRINRFAGVRIGNGGPEIKFDGFNGDVRVLRRTP
jgi:hypothetical protein